MSVESDKLPPVPQHEPPIDRNGVLERFTANWMRWFLQVKHKVDVINQSLVNLGRLTSAGFTVKDADGQWVTRSITGVSGRINVTNGDGISGDPLVDLAELSDTTTGTFKLIDQRDLYGRITGTADGTTSDVPEGTNLYHTPARVDTLIEAQKGIALGIAPLNGAAQIDIAYIPAAVVGQVSYKGIWDASIGTPPTVTPEKGWYYVTTVAGSTNLDGITDWKVGDWAIYNGTAWDKVDNTDAIASWNGRTGAVVPQPGDYTAADVGADPAGTAAAIVAATITNGDTTHAPSGNAVFDALAGKAANSEVLHLAGTETTTGDKTHTGAAVFARSGLLAQNLTVLKDGLGNGFLSMSPTSAAKTITFNATTDALNTTPTGGAVGMVWRLLGVTKAEISALGDFQPGADNASRNGFPSRRWSDVFSMNAANNTSDAREKDLFRDLSRAELAAAIDIARLPPLWKWIAAIAEKGEGARLHCSPTVQDCIAVMESHGLDPFAYGFICYDEWGDLPEIRDEETGEVTQECRPAGDRYSLRPSELAHFIVRGLVHRQDQLEERLAALES